jgi:hypothetical protein
LEIAVVSEIVVSRGNDVNDIFPLLVIRQRLGSCGNCGTHESGVSGKMRFPGFVESGDSGDHEDFEI